MNKAKSPSALLDFILEKGRQTRHQEVSISTYQIVIRVMKKSQAQFGEDLCEKAIFA